MLEAIANIKTAPREPFFTRIGKRKLEMSWSYTKAGHASKMAEVVKAQFEAVQGCPKGTDEEAAKNALGAVAEILCKSFAGNPVVTITASGSAWNEGGKAKSQSCSFKFETLGDFVE